MGAGNEMDDAARLAAAQGVWKSERGFSAVVLLVGWGLKVRFSLIALAHPCSLFAKSGAFLLFHTRSTSS